MLGRNSGLEDNVGEGERLPQDRKTEFACHDESSLVTRI